jgi:disulfide bond formation protein DsbB
MVRPSYIATSILLLSIAFTLSLLMVIRILESNFVLLFIVYIISLIGLVLGIYGVSEKYFRRLGGNANHFCYALSTPQLV